MKCKIKEIFLSLFLSHYPFEAARFNEECNGIELGHLEPFDGIAAHVQNAVFAFFSYFSNGLNTRAVQVAVELAGLDEQMILYVAFHLFP
jgi:hypothetical protein